MATNISGVNPSLHTGATQPKVTKPAAPPPKPAPSQQPGDRVELSNNARALLQKQNATSASQINQHGKK